jgi:hypothetical protein
VGKQQRWRFWGFSCLLVLVASLVSGSVIATAAGTSNKATLNITAPASAPSHTPFNVTLSGKAGKYNEVSVSTYASKCPATVLGTTNSAAVKSNHKFKVTLSTFAIQPGTHWVCAYLWKRHNLNGSNIHKSKTFQAT